MNVHAHRLTGSAAEVVNVSFRSAFFGCIYHSQYKRLCILQKMKLKKASGLDDLTTGHLRYGGPTIIILLYIWLTEFLNSTVELECIPATINYNLYLQRRREGSP